MRAILLSLALLGAEASHARPGQFTDLVIRGFLTEQKLVRIFVDSAPGMGHQSASANVLRRLRQLGYDGDVEVIYRLNDQSRAEMRDKMAALFPGYNQSGPLIQNLVRQKTKFIDFKTFQLDASPFVELAIAGADDRRLNPQHFNARILLTLQPPGWNGPRTVQIQGPQLIETHDIQKLKALGVHFDLAQTPLDFEAEPSPDAYVPPQILAGLRAIDQKRGEIDTAVYYGHGLYQGTDQLMRYLQGILKAQRDEPRTFDHGVVVPIFLETKPGSLSAIRARIAQSPLSQSLIAVGAEDPRLPRLIDSLRPGVVLAVIAGRVTPDLFAYFLTNSTLAPVAGGRNSMNLLGLTGRPYFTSNDRESHHFGDDETDLKGNLRSHAPGFHDAQRGRYAMMSWSTDEEAVSDIAEFLRAARHRHSPIRRLFSASRLTYDSNSDLLTRGLLEVIRLRSLPVAAPATEASEGAHGECHHALTEAS